MTVQFAMAFTISFMTLISFTSFHDVFGAVTAPPVCPNAFLDLEVTHHNPANDHCYFLFNIFSPFLAADELCSSLDLDLLELDSTEEWVWYCSQTGCAIQTWLGIIKKGSFWEWKVSGKTIQATDSRFDGGNGNYAYTQNSGRWGPNTGSGSYRVVCEQRDVIVTVAPTTTTDDVVTAGAVTPVTSGPVTAPPMPCAALIDIGTYYNDTTSCYHFYVCIAPMNLVRSQCHQSMYWDQGKKECDIKANVACGITEPTQPPIQKPSEFTCDHRLVGTYPDPTSCTRYLSCDRDGNTRLWDCGMGLYYHPTNYNCDYPFNVKSCNGEISSRFHTQYDSGEKCFSFTRITEGQYDIMEDITADSLMDCMAECVRVGESMCVAVAFDPGNLAPCKRITDVTNAFPVDCSKELTCYGRNIQKYPTGYPIYGGFI